MVEQQLDVGEVIAIPRLGRAESRVTAKPSKVVNNAVYTRCVAKGVTRLAACQRTIADDKDDVVIGVSSRKALAA